MRTYSRPLPPRQFIYSILILVFFITLSFLILSIFHLVDFFPSLLERAGVHLLSRALLRVLGFGGLTFSIIVFAALESAEGWPSIGQMVFPEGSEPGFNQEEEGSERSVNQGQALPALQPEPPAAFPNAAGAPDVGGVPPAESAGSNQQPMLVAPEIAIVEAAFQGIFSHYDTIADLIQELHHELNILGPGEHQCEELVEMLVARHGESQLPEIQWSLQTYGSLSPYFGEVQTLFQTLRDSGGTETQLRKEWEGQE